MRTTVSLDKDVAAAVRQLRQREGMGLSEALNRIARAGLAVKAKRRAFHQRSYPMGDFKIDVTNVAEALELLEGPAGR